MDALHLARWQFGITTVYHFLFVPLTIGLAPLVAIMHTAYVRTGKDVYRRMTKFWGKLFLINFALGVVTGIVQEFQFGMNWSSYSRFVGDIFGAPLALEGLLAFFLESTFLGIWIFGWDRIPPKLHLASIWLVALGTTVSAFFILAANSFMQWPLGYTINQANGRAELSSFADVLTNPHLWLQFPHVVVASWVTGAFFLLAISAWHLLRKHETDLFLRSSRIALVVGFIASLGVAFIGHAQAQMMTRQQPMKMAAAEALWDTESGVGFSLFAVGDVENGRNHINIQIPRALSILATNTLTGTVEGINDIQASYESTYGPGSYIPMVGVIYWTFRLMVGAGFLMAGIAAVGLWFMRKRDLTQVRWWLIASVVGLALPFLANSTGWILAEMGRQPWVVFGVLRTPAGVSPAVSWGTVLTSLIGFTVLYGILAVIEFTLMWRTAKAGPPPPSDDAADPDERVVAPLIAY